MPRPMSDDDLKEAAERKHTIWVCHFGTRNARLLSRALYRLFKEDRRLEKERGKK